MERSRTFTWEDPAIGFGKALQMSGLEYIQAMKDGKLPGPPIMLALDFKLKSIEKGNAVFSFNPFEFHYNPIGCVHGGVITTVLDSAMGCAIHSMLPAGKAYTTLELKVNFLKAINKDSGELLATGKIIHSGNKTALVEAQMTDDKGKIYAHSLSTCLIFSTEK